MITQAGRDRTVGEVRKFRIQVFLTDHLLKLGEPLGFIFLAIGVLRVCLEVQEVRTHRAITVLEAGQNDAVFHLGHLRARVDHQCVGGTRGPRRVPNAAGAFTRGTRLEDIGRAAGTADHGFGFKDMEVTRADIEADSTRDAVFLGVVHQEVGDADTVEDLVGRLLSGFGNDRLVRFTVDHDLPTALTQIGSLFLVAHNRQAPIFEIVDRGVDVAGHVKRQIFAYHTHQVDTRIMHVIFRVVLTKAGTHVAVDRVQTLGHGTGTVDVGLFGDHDLLVLPPVPGLPGCARTAKAGTGNEDVDIVFDDGFVSH